MEIQKRRQDVLVSNFSMAEEGIQSLIFRRPRFHWKEAGMGRRKREGVGEFKQRQRREGEREVKGEI